MTKRSSRGSRKNLVKFIFIVFLFSYLPAFGNSAQSLNTDEKADAVVANRGYIEYRQIPEVKKGTVIVQKGQASRFSSVLKEENLTALQKQARIYRNQGLEMQRLGNLDAALTFYQKAIELDPAYSVAYNDLGIIYEAKGLIDQAEESYLKSIKIDPLYLSAYSNLALLYENKRDLEKAAFYWEKRVQLGSSNDPWKDKARQRLADIRAVLSESPIGKAREQEILSLMRDVAIHKSKLRQVDKALSQEHFEKAKQSYNKGDFATAIKEALDAQYLDPSNEEIEKFIDKTRTKVLSR